MKLQASSLNNQSSIFFVIFYALCRLFSLFCEEYQVTELQSAAIHILVCPVLLPYSCRIHYNVVQTLVTRRQHQHFSWQVFKEMEMRQPVNSCGDVQLFLWKIANTWAISRLIPWKAESQNFLATIDFLQIIMPYFFSLRDRLAWCNVTEMLVVATVGGVSHFCYSCGNDTGDC